MQRVVPSDVPLTERLQSKARPTDTDATQLGASDQSVEIAAGTVGTADAITDGAQSAAILSTFSEKVSLRSVTDCSISNESASDSAAPLSTSERWACCCLRPSISEALVWT